MQMLQKTVGPDRPAAFVRPPQRPATACARVYLQIQSQQFKKEDKTLAEANYRCGFRTLGRLDADVSGEICRFKGNRLTSCFNCAAFFYPPKSTFFSQDGFIGNTELWEIKAGSLKSRPSPI